MGATSWHYYTSYREDPEEALQRLRAEVFARGDYLDVTGPLDNVLRDMAQRAGQDPDVPEVRNIIDSSLRLQRAIDTGDMSGLSRSERSMAQRVRALGALGQGLGATRSTQRGRRPRSIEELLDRAAECGTHSILDIEHVGQRPRFAVAAPLSSAARMQIFGTTEPVHEQVEELWEEVAEGLDRWHARYLVVYRDGRPDEIAFIGCSGD